MDKLALTASQYRSVLLCFDAAEDRKHSSAASTFEISATHREDNCISIPHQDLIAGNLDRGTGDLRWWMFDRDLRYRFKSDPKVGKGYVRPATAMTGILIMKLVGTDNCRL
jgi:hypothetical protein